MKCDYKYEGKTYVIEEDEINSLMDKWDITEPEAVELYLNDTEVIENETVTELTNKANKNRVLTTIHGTKGEKKVRKPREKKVNPLKNSIMSIIVTALTEQYGEINVTNPERSCDFTINGKNFSVNLVEHRPKK